MGTGYPLDPPLDRHKGAPGQELAPGVGGLREEKRGMSRRIPRIPALQVPSRHPRGRRVGPQGTPVGASISTQLGNFISQCF